MRPKTSTHHKINPLGWKDKAWVDQELDGAYFQDVRLGKRLRTLLGLMSNGLGQSIPLACQDWANTKAAYRFFSNPRINDEEILSGHFASTQARAAAIEEPLLVLHDTTEFTFQSNGPSIGLITNLPRKRTGVRFAHALQLGGHHRRSSPGIGGGEVLDSKALQGNHSAQAHSQSNPHSD